MPDQQVLDAPTKCSASYAHNATGNALGGLPPAGQDDWLPPSWEPQVLTNFVWYATEPNKVQMSLTGGPYVLAYPVSGFTLDDATPLQRLMTHNLQTFWAISNTPIVLPRSITIAPNYTGIVLASGKRLAPGTYPITDGTTQLADDGDIAELLDDDDQVQLGGEG